MKPASIITFAVLSNTPLALAETQFTVSPSLIYFDYTEFSPTGQQLNNETGWLPGIFAGITHAIDSNWSTDVFATYYSGSVDYDGQTQSGTPHQTETATSFFRLGLRVNYAFTDRLGVFVSGQSHTWDRDIQDNNNVSGLYEQYRWMEYASGLDYEIALDQKNHFVARASVLMIRDANIYVDLSRVDFGTAQLDIGNGTGARLALEWNRQHNQSIDYGIGLFLEGWDFGRSNTEATMGGSNSVYVTEPRSETRNFGLRLNFKYTI